MYATLLLLCGKGSMTMLDALSRLMQVYAVCGISCAIPYSKSGFYLFVPISAVATRL